MKLQMLKNPPKRVIHSKSLDTFASAKLSRFKPYSQHIKFSCRELHGDERLISCIRSIGVLGIYQTTDSAIWSDSNRFYLCTFGVF